MPRTLAVHHNRASYKQAVTKYVRGLLFPPGHPYKQPRNRLRGFIRAVETDVLNRHGEINSRLGAIMEVVRRSARVLVLVDDAIRHDVRILVPETGRLDLTNQAVRELLEMERKAMWSLTNAMEKLDIPLSHQPASEWERILTPERELPHEHDGGQGEESCPI